MQRYSTYKGLNVNVQIQDLMFMFKSDKMLLTVQKEVNIIYLYGKKYIYMHAR